MKKVAVSLSMCFFITITGFSQGLTNRYNKTECGLSYIESSVRLGKKMAAAGMLDENGDTLFGVDQPAALVISGIPLTATIEKAFIWWDFTGPGITDSVTVQNPDSAIVTFHGTLIGTGGVERCWGGGASAFRADVTSIISGNGSYRISGLPTDTIVSDSTNDVNGATLFIIYSDSAASYTGTLLMNDGYVLVNYNTVTQTITDINPPGIDTIATAFMIISDLENINFPLVPNKIMMNNGNYQGVQEDFWDYEERITGVLSTQTTSTFVIQAPWDCCNFIMMGLYYRKNTDTTLPTITRNWDTLTSNPASSYQWNLNGVHVSGATNQTYIATQAGSYSVTVDNGSGCYFTSEPTIIICIENFKPNIYSSGSDVWTDPGFTDYQWYMDSTLIPGATDSTYTAADTTYYWVQVTDSLGCVSSSDTIYVIPTGISEANFQSTQIMLHPNPNTGNFLIVITTEKVQDLELKLTNFTGQLIFNERIKRAKGTITREMNIQQYSKGIYLFKVIDSFGVSVRKVVIY
ncbi:MAG: T9SS type A sorting domain-containing protein [Bacteroidota bacterium]